MASQYGKINKDRQPLKPLNLLPLEGLYGGDRGSGAISVQVSQERRLCAFLMEMEQDVPS